MSASPPPPVPPVGEADLLAYVDDRLSPARRREVEDYLADHPEHAHRVAADMAILEGLRLLCGRPANIPVPHRMARRSWWRRAALSLAVAAYR